jgi:hypothetical protein
MLTKDTPPVPPSRPEPRWAEVVVGLGAVTTIVGLITWFTAYSGVDDWRQIQVGMLITGFGVTWAILGQILRSVQRRP